MVVLGLLVVVVLGLLVLVLALALVRAGARAGAGAGAGAAAAGSAADVCACICTQVFTHVRAIATTHGCMPTHAVFLHVMSNSVELCMVLKVH